MQDYEKNSSKFDQAIADVAQTKSWEALYKISQSIKPGISELEAEKMAITVLREMGARKFWHPVHIRFGENTLKGYREESEPDVILQENDIFFIDIGPIFHGHEGDCGKTFVIGSDDRLLTLSNNVKKIWDGVRDYWLKGNSGQALWNKAKESAARYGLELAPLYVKGHRISDFPHEAITRNKMFDMVEAPHPKRWVLEIQVVDNLLNRGAFYEDILQ